MQKTHKQKVKMARRMMSQEEKSAKVKPPIFGTKAWIARRQEIMDRLAGKGRKVRGPSEEFSSERYEPRMSPWRRFKLWIKKLFKK